MDRESAVKCIHVDFIAQRMLSAANDDIAQLPEPVQVFLKVNGAQGVLDNGGFRYFFESDWPGNPPYEDFASAYEAIGCWKQATELRRVVETFPFPEPHLHKDKRNEYIEANYDPEKMHVRDWGDELCGDDEIWKKLAAYYDWHKPHFQASVEKPELPLLRFPTRHARDADNLALMALLGGVYFLVSRAGIAPNLLPWFIGSGVISIVAGVLLWLRVPHAKWLGVLVFAILFGIFARSLILRGWSIIGCLQLLMPIFCAYWLARIDYDHVFVDEDDE